MSAFDWKFAKVFDPSDGLYVNTIKYGRRISRLKDEVSHFENDMVMTMSLKGMPIVRHMGIMRHVRKINRYKSTKLNGYKGLLNQKA